jgi:hypothetical protein
MTRQSPSRDHLAALLDFAWIDLAEQSVEALAALRARLAGLAMPSSGHVTIPLNASTLPWVGRPVQAERNAEPLRRALASVQANWRAALETLRDGNDWAPPLAAVPIRWRRPRKDGTRIMERVWSGTPDRLLLTAGADLLLRFGDGIRSCQGNACGRLFLPADPRQKYCSTDCRQRTLWSRFAPTRERDYAAEYQRRQDKRHGRKVKIMSRKRP